jgi:hypothetical protein
MAIPGKWLAALQKKLLPRLRGDRHAGRDGFFDLEWVVLRPVGGHARCACITLATNLVSLEHELVSLRHEGCSILAVGTAVNRRHRQDQSAPERIAVLYRTTKAGL